MINFSYTHNHGLLAQQKLAITQTHWMCNVGRLMSCSAAGRRMMMPSTEQQRQLAGLPTVLVTG